MVHTAKEWGLTPSEFFGLDGQDKALMMVYTNIVSKMEAAADREHERKMKANKGKR